MRKVILPIVALASIAAAAPATAQYYGGNNYGYGTTNGRGIQQRIQRVSYQIDRMHQRGALTNSEARSLRRELGYVADRANRYRWDDYRPGYNRGERGDLWNRLARLEQRVRYEARDGDRRYGYGYGYGDRDRDGVPNRYDRYDGNPYRR